MNYYLNSTLWIDKSNKLKKMLLIIVSIYLISLLIGCGKEEETAVTAEIYETDIYKISILEFKTEEQERLFNFAILKNKYKLKLAEIEENLNTAIKQYEMMGYDLNEMLEYYNYDDFDAYYDDLFYGELTTLAIEDYAKSLITTEEINKFYDEKIFGSITTKHILINNDYNYENALREANEIINRLDNGESFDELAKKLSDDVATLLTFNYGELDEQYEEAVKNLEVGSYTRVPVHSEYGYFIIYKVSEEEKPELNKVKNDIIEMLVSDKLSNYPTLYVEALENFQRETIDYLLDLGISEVLIDTESYILYDINGMSIYEVCLDETCDQFEHLKLDLQKNNIIE